jgi:putative hydrolase of the HAD superfamily
MAETFEGGRFKEQIKALFASQDWKAYDNGNFNEDVLKAKRHDIPSDKFKEIFNFFLKSLKPKKETIELIKQLDKLGYQQFYLSNGSRTYVNYINSSEYFKNEGFNLSELFSEDQILLSADINISKPHAGIFENAKEKFKLDKRSVIFIDDSFLNIKAATEYAGWDGIQFTDIQKLKSALALKGVFLSSKESKNENNKVFTSS